MAVTMVGPTITDDDGTGTFGTITDAAWVADYTARINTALALLLPLAGGTLTAALSITGLADLTGLILSATTTLRPQVEFKNATTGSLGALFFTNVGDFEVRKKVGGTAAVMQITAAGVLALPSYTATTFAGGDFYLVVNAAGVVHRSAIGPAS